MSTEQTSGMRIRIMPDGPYRLEGGAALIERYPTVNTFDWLVRL